MPAYIIAFVRIQELEAYNREYLEAAHPIVTRHGGEALVVSESVRVLEGDFPDGRVVIVEFPSKEKAEAFYADPDYQPLIEIRKRYTQSDSAIVEKGFGAADEQTATSAG